MLHHLDLKEMNHNVFSLIGDQWMLITAGTEERCNTMTASWGGLGVVWGSACATCYIRPQRYTREFLDEQDCFSLSFLPENRRDVLSLCGSKSGRELDKVEASGLTLAMSSWGAPYFQEAQLVLICRKQLVQPLEPDRIPERLQTQWYPQKDYHILYIGEIIEALAQ